MVVVAAVTLAEEVVDTRPAEAVDTRAAAEVIRVAVITNC